MHVCFVRVLKIACFPLGKEKGHVEGHIHFDLKCQSCWISILFKVSLCRQPSQQMSPVLEFLTQWLRGWTKLETDTSIFFLTPPESVFLFFLSAFVLTFIPLLVLLGIKHVALPHAVHRFFVSDVHNPWTCIWVIEDTVQQQVSSMAIAGVRWSTGEEGTMLEKCQKKAFGVVLA